MNEQIELVAVHVKNDEKGYPQEETKKTMIYAEDISASWGDFYGALQAGRKIERVFRTWQFDFMLGALEVQADENTIATIEPTRVRYKGKEYHILRTHIKDNKEKIDLICEVVS